MGGLLQDRKGCGVMKALGEGLPSVVRRLDVILAGFALTILVAITFVGVFTRYFLGEPFAWEEEMQLACFVWITFLGVGVAFRSGSHVAIELLVERMRPGMAKWVEIFGYVVSMLVFLFFLYYSGIIVDKMIEMGRTTNILHVPYGLIYGVVPVGVVLMMYNYTLSLRERLAFYKEIMHDG